MRIAKWDNRAIEFFAKTGLPVAGNPDVVTGRAAAGKVRPYGVENRG